MMLSEQDRHAVQKTGSELGKLWLIAIAIIVLWIAWDTDGFTKKPSWWSMGLSQTQPALTQAY